jgi:hypothetical protein
VYRAHLAFLTNGNLAHSNGESIIDTEIDFFTTDSIQEKCQDIVVKSSYHTTEVQSHSLARCPLGELRYHLIQGHLIWNDWRDWWQAVIDASEVIASILVSAYLADLASMTLL